MTEAKKTAKAASKASAKAHSSHAYLPSEEVIALARESGRTLSTVLQTRSEVQQIDVHGEKGDIRTVQIPTSALKLLVDVLAELGQGNAVSIIPIHAELTTQEAADVLNISRPFMVQLLEQGAMDFHKVGTHRRVRYQDVMAYKKRTDERRHRALDELSEMAQKLGLQY